MAAIRELPGDRASGPDGFSGAFFKATSGIIIHDLFLAFQQLHGCNGAGLHLINGAHTVLLPKKDDPTTMSDYRPISLLHSVIKIFAKILASRLAKRIDSLIVPVQSAFIKGRCIQDNFLFVQGMARHFHRTKRPMLLIKLDIAKAFDTVSWTYLLDMMRARGFGQRWRDWISMLLSSASSRVLVNGAAGPVIRHRRGLRQGDPLSPFLFILAMEPLQQLLINAVQEGALSKIKGRVPAYRTSMYADDVAIFLNPVKQEVLTLRSILRAFGDATGLRVNFSKSTVLAINSTSFSVPDIAGPLGAACATFPCKFLGLPLFLRKLRKD